MASLSGAIPASACNPSPAVSVTTAPNSMKRGIGRIKASKSDGVNGLVGRRGTATAALRKARRALMRDPAGWGRRSGKRRVYNVRRRLHGHPRVDFGQIDTKNTFTRPRTDIVRRAVRFPVQLALDSRLRGMTDRTNVQHNGVSRGLGSAHRCRLLNESKAVYRFVSRRLTFHTSPHLVHRQYVDAVTTLLVVVSSVDRQAGHADGVVTGSSASLRFVFG